MKLKKQKPTPEQLKEQRLWKAADKACRALLESMESPVRASSLSFSLERGVSLHMSLNLAFNFKIPMRSKTLACIGDSKVIHK